MEVNKTNNQHPLNFFSKLTNFARHFQKPLVYFFLMACGLTIGLILSSYLKNFSSDLQFTQMYLPSISSSTTETTKNSTETQIKKVKSEEPNISHIGLSEYLKPAYVKHDVNDEELLWRASMVSRVPKYPFHRIQKIAFYVLD